jgi:flagellar motor protein MotB
LSWCYEREDYVDLLKLIYDISMSARKGGSGSSRLEHYTRTILSDLVQYLNTVPNRLSGHTDVRPYPGLSGYSNWELSADRANAARRLPSEPMKD